MTIKSLSEKLVSLASKKGIKIGIAESCTGGALASAVVSVAGSSNVLDCSFVTYSDASKIALLRVDPIFIKEYTAVSAIVAKDMAIGALKIAPEATIVLSTTGFAGPSGDKVGLVHMALATKHGVMSKEFQFFGDRSAVIESAVKTGLEMIVNAIEEA